MITVGLVDDQDLFRAGIRVIVDSQPDLSVVGEAADGMAGIAMVDRFAPDVVLMDLQMPGLDGVEATRQLLSPLRRSRRPRPIRVIVLTTFNLDNRAAAAIRAGASGFLLKTCTPPQLLEGIRSVATGSAVVAPGDLATLLDGEFAAPQPPPTELDRLTDRERAVLEAVSLGLSNAEIARRMHASESTIKTHVGAVLRKLGLRDRVQLVVYAYEHGLRRVGEPDPLGSRPGKATDS